MPAAPESVTHVSGLLLTVSPGCLPAVARLSAAVPGVDVHLQDEAGGRLVITVETDTRRDLESACATLAALPGVQSLALTCDYVDEERAS
ncbi:MAG: chaperone NapD [Acidobacteria bacterium]|nr:chaperone NapD [Acidobacteriota bacterium]